MAAAGFHEFVWKLLRSSPPPRFRGLSEEDREDIIADLVAKWLANDFKALRAYKDTGRPFAGYVATAANNRAIDFWRRRSRSPLSMDDPKDEDPVERLEDPAVPQDERVFDQLELEQVAKCLERLSDRCQVLLRGAADGYRPRELTILVGWPRDWNKKAHDALRDCRKSLTRCLEKQPQ